MERIGRITESGIKMERIGRITEIRKDWDGGFELTAEFDAGETFANPDLRHLLGSACVYEYHGSFKMVSQYDIRHIYHNNTKNVTVVVWETGDKTKVKLADGETSNIYNAVAAAVMERKYGSNSAFKASIERNLGGYWDAAYLVIARWEVSEIYGSREAFKKIVDEKLILHGFVWRK